MLGGFSRLFLLGLSCGLAMTLGIPERQALDKREVTLDPRAANALPGQPNYTSIPNGVFWYDTDGNAINAHGGGFLKVDDWYYWVGQAFSTGLPPYSEALVNLYKSQDLMNWEFVTSPITVYTPDENGNKPFTYCNVERPKLLYNPNTKKYVLWGHWEMRYTYRASHSYVATADNIEGPYTITEKAHFRPGAGNNDSDAMGDRVGRLLWDYSSSARDDSNTTRPLKPISGASYPPKVLQYKNQNLKNLQEPIYLTESGGYGTAQTDNSWTYELTNVQWGMILKVVSVQMTPWDATYYNMYTPYFSVSANSYDYVIRYPTTNRSEVATYNYTIGDPEDERTALVPPEIHPGLDESSSDSVVFVHTGDAAFVTCNTTSSSMYYTTDGSAPTTSSSQYWTGTRLPVTGSPGYNMTVKAICVLNNQTSPVVSQTYQVVDNSTSVPIFRPVVSLPSGTYKSGDSAFGYKSVKIYCPTYNTECYYTMDGIDPHPPVLGANIGYGSRDPTVWQDPKDKAVYLISASDNNYVRFWLLNDDWTDVIAEKEYDIFTRQSREAPVLVRHGGASGEYVYIITSTQTGWYPNQGQYKRTSDVTAGFDVARDATTGYRNASSTWSKLEPIGDSSTYYTQPNYILNVGTDDEPQYIYVGDRHDASNQWQSTNVFMPLSIDDDAPAVTGDEGSGLMTLKYTPSLGVDLANHSLVEPKWRLLSLNKPVNSSTATQLTADQVAAGTYNYSAQAANDGINYDLDGYDSVQQYFKPTSVPFYWQVDLGEVYELAWVGLSFMSIGGSDAVHRYTVTASADGSYFMTLADNTGNLHPGFMAHVLSGSYRYVKLNVFSVWDVAHNKEADWEAAVYEVSVYGYDAGPNTTTSSTISGSSSTTSFSSQTSSSLLTVTTTTKSPGACAHDNCLRQFLGATALVSPFCATYTTAVNTATASLPTYVSQCQSNPTRISSACSCVMTATA